VAVYGNASCSAVKWFIIIVYRFILRVYKRDAMFLRYTKGVPILSKWYTRG